KFITPEELEAWLLGNNLAIRDRTGVVYNPLSGEWRQSRDMAVNYMIVAQKPSNAG
ncbi:MAG: bifunctional 3-demethylubiquinol 3-O-methyltransferase/2-polyprenyl-6-hydroxyphenol methylase, partial [Rhizobiales bacterium]|nr:bifunctional 3-demethylubiquinol 3-O-methyltransferase/2-polyprenyl-6-hydroxyphenol methylase [Hyphomicrobiales bacterium]